MGKRHKNHHKPARRDRRDVERGVGASDEANGTPRIVPHPPVKQPLLLGISLALFVLWLIFLLVTAWPR